MAFDWRQWMEMLDGNRTTPPEAIRHYKPYRSLSTVEINDFSIANNHVFGAAGDSFGYKWDLETLKILATYPAAKRGYLHSIQCMPNDNTVLMGGEDGFLGIWDGHQDKLIDNIDIEEAMEKDSSLVEQDESIGNTPMDTANTFSSSMWISNIHSPSDSWWTICGGIQHLPTKHSSPRNSPRNSPILTASPLAGGHVTSWHAPTRSLVAGRFTRSTPQYSCSTAGSLVTVANEGVVSYWTPSSLQRTGRAWCSSPSCFSAAIGGNKNDDDASAMLAVGGVGNQVDIFGNIMGNKSFSLVLQ